MKNFIVSILISSFFISCDSNIKQYPVSYKNDDFLKRSQERGKILLKEEISWFNEYKNKSNLTFNKTESGIWISNEGKRTNTTANVGDYIEFTYQITDLDNNIIYSYKDIGNQKIILGKADIIRGLHSALQLIESNNEAKILIPSFLAYGGYGDSDKILPDQPLIMDIKVLTIKKNI